MSMISYLQKKPARQRTGQAGYVLATLSVLLVFLIASVGLGVDLGTAFVVRSEAQAFCDSAALTAALKLDGTSLGISRARTAALEETNRWLFGTTAFGSVVVEFAPDADGPWESNPMDPVGYGFVRVSTGANAPMTFLPLVTNENIAVVNTRAVAGQIEKNTFYNGVFPYSPFAHVPSVADDFGFSKGTKYTLRWPNNMNKHAKPCPGDENVEHVVQMKIDSGDSIQGYIDSGSASWIREAIITSEQHETRVYTVGEPIFMSTGNKQTEEDAMQTRVGQDTNTSALTYEEYRSSGTGNGRRMVLVPINGGPNTNFRIIGFASFFLGQVNDYKVSPSDSFCAEYVGSAVLGGTTGGANPGSGAYSVRLVR